MRALTGVTAASLCFLVLTSSTCYGATIYACKKKIGGTIRIVRAATICLPTEAKMSWNSVGPQGPMGLPGNLALAGQKCRGGQVITGYTESGDIKCSWQFHDPDLQGANFPNSDFSDANMPGARFRLGNFTNSDFSNANLFSAVFGNANFSGANLSGAMLIHVVFSQAPDGGPNLSNANLSNANCSNSQMEFADFSGANLTGVDFTNTRFAYTNLTGATMTGAIVTNVTWVEVTCPDGTNSNTNGTSPESCEGHLILP